MWCAGALLAFQHTLPQQPRATRCEGRLRPCQQLRAPASLRRANGLSAAQWRLYAQRMPAVAQQPPHNLATCHVKQSQPLMTTCMRRARWKDHLLTKRGRSGCSGCRTSLPCTCNDITRESLRYAYAHPLVRHDQPCTARSASHHPLSGTRSGLVLRAIHATEGG